MTSATEVAGRLFLAVYRSSSKRSPDPPRRAGFRTRNRSACKFSAGDGRGAARTCRILLRLPSNHGQGFKPGYFRLADEPANCFSFSMDGGTHCPGSSFPRPNPKWPRKLEFRNSFRARRCHSVFGLCGALKTGLRLRWRSWQSVYAQEEFGRRCRITLGCLLGPPKTSSHFKATSSTVRCRSSLVVSGLNRKRRYSAQQRR